MENNYLIDLKAVGMRIRKARKEMRLTQAEAARRADLSPQYWSMLEIGKDRGSVCTYLQMVVALDVRLDDLFYDDAALARTARALSRDEFLADCTPPEQMIITETMLSLRSALIRVRRK